MFVGVRAPNIGDDGGDLGQECTMACAAWSEADTGQLRIATSAGKLSVRNVIPWYISSDTSDDLAVLRICTPSDVHVLHQQEKIPFGIVCVDATLTRAIRCISLEPSPQVGRTTVLLDMSGASRAQALPKFEPAYDWISVSPLSSDPLSVEKPSQPSPAHDPVTSEGELPAGAEPGETKDAPEVEKTPQTRPDMLPEVDLDDVYYKKFDIYTQEEKTKVWSDAAGMVQTYSDEMIKRWKEEIDTYLVFAGLFSAVLTTFNVQSYLLLQPAAPDPSIAVLQQISSQLASFSIHPPFVNSTQPPSTTRANASTAPPVPRWAIWLNTLWFSGLILSLASASVGIMTKQWLNEYSSGVSGTSRHIARVRLHRLNNMRRWHVEDVINTIPVLLQLALALYLAGLLILLW
ncbi:hypothetical protein VTO73DRAFT_4859 [Trametes versicolor]